MNKQNGNKFENLESLSEIEELENVNGGWTIPYVSAAGANAGYIVGRGVGYLVKKFFII